MKTVLKIIGLLLFALVVVAGGLYAWASVASSRMLARTYQTHDIDFPIPFPATDVDLALAGPDVDADAYSRELARARGEHLVQARYACVECHGGNFGGGVMVDAFPIGRILGPNLTKGTGGKTANYTAADWDRIVRHGVRPDGTPSAMPSEDYQLMSDQELSDIVVFIESRPPITNETAPVKLGPLGKVLMARGELRLSADLISSHDTPHAAFPPPAEPTVEFGRHLAGVCTGCHHLDLGGGPIAGGDPSWAPARNITPDATGIGGWTFEQFVAAMRDGKRPDGSLVQAPMTMVTPYANRMTDVEMDALWVYLQTVPAVTR